MTNLASEAFPIRKMMSALLKITANDVRAKIPSACPKNERAEAKRTAEEFFNTKYFVEVCDFLNLPADKIKKQVMLDKNKFDELPDMEVD